MRGRVTFYFTKITRIVSRKICLILSLFYIFLSLFYSFYIDFFSIFTEECYDNQDNSNNEVIRTCSAVKALSEVIFFILF